MTGCVLALESGGATASAALITPSGALRVATAETGQSHSSRLLPLAQELLSQAGLQWSDLTGIAVGAGPGSFTGLRIACGLAQGIALGQGTPLLAVSGFEANAYAWWVTHRDALSADGDDAVADACDGRMFEISFDARLGERYAAVLNLQMVNDQLELEWIEAPSVVSADSEFVASPEIRLDTLNNARQSSGQGNSIQLKDPSTELLGDDRLPLAAWIARFACDPRRSRMQNWVGPEELSPLYVREKVAQTISERLVTPDLVWSPMRLNDLASVMVIENQAYPFPWTSGNFTDSLTAGYEMSVLKEQNVMVGYLVWMAVVDEAHLLNIALSPARQGRGLGLWMMRYFIAQARTREFSKILLEVRPSNHGAIRLYRFLGFQKIGQRKGYYPQSAGSSKEREDAIVMQLALRGDPRV
ncbi:MAG: ribosomal-protein-alanine acetyltransferase [Pseudomonadota bacterium]